MKTFIFNKLMSIPLIILISLVLSCVATPQANDPAETEKVSTPTFKPQSGSFSPSQTVTISTATSGASINYSTDASIPTCIVGTLYSSAISISATTTLKAIACKLNMTDSDVSSATFVITGGDQNEPNDTQDNATNIITDTTYNAVLHVNSDIDYYKIVLTPGIRYTYSLYNLPVGQTRIEITDGTDNWFWIWIQGATNQTRNAGFTPNQTGNYYIKIFTTDDSSSTEYYQLSLKKDAYEPNEVDANAASINIGTTYNAILDPGTDTDIFKMNLTASIQYSYTLYNLPVGQTKVEIYDGTDYWFWIWNQGAIGQTRSDVFTPNQTAVYYIKIYTTDSSNSTDYYQITIN